jgi:hypothetical protein
MKTHNFILISLFALALMASTSCKKKDPGGNGIGTDDCSASWKVDGKKYDKKDMTLCVYLDSTLNVSSSASGGDFQLQVDPIFKTGTYVADVNNNKLTVFVMIKLDDGTQIVSNNVSINVNELSNKKANGTFSGDFFDIQDITMDPKYKVTDGQFSSKF